jgi:CheY-like chemotaxis protein
VFSVNNAKDAIVASKNNSFDVILMDINLKNDTNGIEATQIIRKINGYETKPIVAMTAFASASDREEFLNSGFSHYISKPFYKKDILQLLESIVK